MRWISLLIVSLFALAFSPVLPSQEPSKRNVSEPALRKELLERVKRDQEVREESIASDATNPNEDIIARMHAIDSSNTARMKEIVAEYGWPSPKRVGLDGVQAAFLIVQHAEFGFQKEMLPLIERAFKDGTLPGQSYALLFDRVQVRSGKPQIYGTQAKIVEGEIVFETIDDEANVDKRRGDLGLPPISEYRKMLKDLYFPGQKGKQ